MNSQTGKIIIAAGILIVLAGIIVYFFHNRLHWIGRLPGDIRIEREHFRFYFPITTLILLSIIVRIILAIIRRLH